MSLPVESTGLKAVDPIHNLYSQVTARGDRIFIAPFKGVLSEVAVLPVEGRPLLRLEAMSNGLESRLTHEATEYAAPDAATAPAWRKLDEENWAAEMEQLGRILIQQLCLRVEPPASHPE